MHIDHINIRAPQPLLARVRRFYCEVLGLSEGFRPAFSSGGHWLYAGERPIIHLSLGEQDLGERPVTHLDHVAFRATGLASFRARLDGAGIDYRSSYIPELGLTQLFFSDPAGNGIELNFAAEPAE